MHTITDQRRLWLELTTVQSQVSIPWLVRGDFNTYISVGQHFGRSMHVLPSLEEFVECVHRCALMDLPFQGSPFTWVGRRGLRTVRLDRILCNVTFNNLFHMLRLRHLSRLTSNHVPLLLTPLLLKCVHTSISAPKPFRF